MANNNSRAVKITLSKKTALERAMQTKHLYHWVRKRLPLSLCLILLGQSVLLPTAQATTRASAQTTSQATAHATNHITSHAITHTISHSKTRPKVGLVLSGGGARGAAHIGVIKVLEQMQIPIDYIAGTSMGSIIGGLYASGMTVTEIETAIKTLDWEHIFNDNPPRLDKSFRRKRDDDIYLVKSKPGITSQGELKFPTGAIQGQKFDLVLRELTQTISSTGAFDNLYIPFRAVASDIETGKKVVLSSGDLATAMRASMSIPGVFAATEIDGRLLVDGGITDNIPIDVARDMGADIVIAVDISTPYLPAAEVNNVITISLQLTSILTRTNADRQLATLHPDDILLVPELGSITSSEFTRAGEAITKGQESAEKQRDKLAHLSLSAAQYQDYLATRSARPLQQAPIIQFIRVNNNATVSDSLIRERIHQPLGQPLDQQQLQKDISTVYGLELFQAVQYDVVEEQGKTGLLINASARSWGPNYLQLGIELSSDQQGQNNYNLGLGYLRTGINDLNGELRTGIQFGADPLIVGEWYQPLDPRSHYFVDTSLKYGAKSIGVYNSDYKHIADYRAKGSEVDVAVGREISTFSEVRLGYGYRTGEVKVETGPPDWSAFNYNTALLYGRLSFDRLDNYDFPNQGWLSVLQYSSGREALGSDVNFEQFTLRGSKFIPIDEDNVFGMGGLLYTTLAGTAEIQDRYRLGGFLNLSGFANDSLSGQQAALLNALYYHRFKSTRLLSWYGGASLEYGGVWEDKADIGSDGIAAGSLFLGADTPIGPVYLGFGQAEQGNSAIFFNLGRPLFY